MKRIILISFGFIALLLGTLGSFLPILPTAPFLMISVYCFTASSTKITNWFKQTKLYKNNLEDLMIHKGMKRSVKIKIMTTITLFMLIGFVKMGTKGLIPGCILLFIIWIFHILYFTYFIKTL